MRGGEREEGEKEKEKKEEDLEMTILSLYIGDINRLFSTFVSGNLHSNVGLRSSSQPPRICRSQVPH